MRKLDCKSMFSSIASKVNWNWRNFKAKTIGSMKANRIIHFSEVLHQHLALPSEGNTLILYMICWEWRDLSIIRLLYSNNRDLTYIIVGKFSNVRTLSYKCNEETLEFLVSTPKRLLIYWSALHKKLKILWQNFLWKLFFF